MNQKLRLRSSVAAAALAALFAGSALAQTPPPRRPRRRRPPSPTGRSPATSACTASTCSAASRRPTRSRRSRAASTSGTRAASTSARGRRTSRGCPTATPTSPRRLEWDFYGGYKWSLPADFVARPRRPLLLVPGHLPVGLHQAQHDRAVRRAQLEDAARSSTATASSDTFGFPNSERLRTTSRATLNWDVVDKVNDYDRQGHAHRPRRLPVVQEQRRSTYYGDWKVGVSTEICGRDRRASSAPAPTPRARSTPTASARTSATRQFVGYVQKTF